MCTNHFACFSCPFGPVLMVGGDGDTGGRNGNDAAQPAQLGSKGLISIRDALLRVGDERLKNCCTGGTSGQNTEVFEQDTDTNHYPFLRFPSLQPRHKRNAHKRMKREKQAILHQLTTSTTKLEPSFSVFPLWRQPVDEERRRKRNLKLRLQQMQNGSEGTTNPEGHTPSGHRTAENSSTDGYNDDHSVRQGTSPCLGARKLDLEVLQDDEDSDECAGSHEEGYSGYSSED